MAKKQSVVQRTLKLAGTKYADNAVVAAMLRMVLNSQKLVALEASDNVNMLAGYARGVAGEDGFVMPHGFDVGAFSPMFRQWDRMRAFTEQFTMLVVALQALGEEIDY